MTRSPQLTSEEARTWLRPRLQAHTPHPAHPHCPNEAWEPGNTQVRELIPAGGLGQAGLNWAPWSSSRSATRRLCDPAAGVSPTSLRAHSCKGAHELLGGSGAAVALTLPGRLQETLDFSLCLQSMLPGQELFKPSMSISSYSLP